jgi:anti-sigma28 factor (negative regulator of flagellin synthesis)
LTDIAQAEKTIMLIPNELKPECDTCRIAAIRSQLDEDQYIVDPQQIANKFIDLEVAIYGHN